MKKALALLLLVAMLASLCACGAKKTAGDTNTPVSQAPSDLTPDDQTPGDDEVSDVEVYENELIGIGFRPGDGWEIWDDEQIAQINGIVADMMTDEAIRDMLASSGYAQPFYAQAQSGLLTANITIEDLGVLYGATLDEQAYVEIAMEQMTPALESMGLSDITSEVGTVNFAGQDRTAVFISGSMQGAELHETIVTMKVGNYMANVTAASYLTDETADILSMFYAL